MKQKLLIPLSIACLTGILLFFYMNEWIIFRFPSYTSSLNFTHTTQKKNKPISLFFWKNNRWHTETETVVWSDDTQENIEAVISRWLYNAKEDQCITYTVTLQSVLLSQHSDIAYASFNTSLLDENKPTHANILLIEGLLRTLHTCNLSVQKIMFLVNHKPLINTHLDFSSPWPLSGL